MRTTLPWLPSKSKKKASKVPMKPPPLSPKSPPVISQQSQDSLSSTVAKGAPTIPVLSEKAPQTPKNHPKVVSGKSEGTVKIPIDSPQAKTERDRIFETPKQFYSRMARALPPKECPKSDLYTLPFPLDDNTFAKFSAIDSDAWSDSFCGKFHVSIESDPANWISLSSKFDDVSTLHDLQTFLAIHSKNQPLAFLGFDRKKNPVVIHNMFVSPDSGSVLAPEPVFLCFTKDSFDVPPGTFDPEELSSILKSLDYMRIPTFDEIIADCVQKDSNSLSGLSLKASVFSAYNPYLAYPDNQSDDPNDVQFREDHSFECKSFILIPPSISGDLIKFLDPSCGQSNSQRSIPDLVELCSPRSFPVGDALSRTPRPVLPPWSFALPIRIACVFVMPFAFCGAFIAERLLWTIFSLTIHRITVLLSKQLSFISRHHFLTGQHPCMLLLVAHAHLRLRGLEISPLRNHVPLPDAFHRLIVVTLPNRFPRMSSFSLPR